MPTKFFSLIFLRLSQIFPAGSGVVDILLAPTRLFTASSGKDAAAGGTAAPQVHEATQGPVGSSVSPYGSCWSLWNSA